MKTEHKMMKCELCKGLRMHEIRYKNGKIIYTCTSCLRSYSEEDPTWKYNTEGGSILR